MIRRPLELGVLTLACGWLALSYSNSSWSGLVGAVVGSVVWVVWDNIRAVRVLKWLRTGRPEGSPEVSAVWAEVVERSRRGLQAMDRRVRKSETRLDEFLAAIQASPNGVVLLGKGDTIEWCNHTAAQHLGFDPKRDLHQIIRNLVRNPVFTNYLKLGQFDAPIEIDGRQTFPGQQLKISVQVHPYGKARKLLLSRDVTALQLAEAMRRDFVANVSHEIRTPLTVVSGFVETMLNLDLNGEERRKYLDLMHVQAQRMQTLVSDLLTLSRLDGSPLPGASEWVSATSLLQQVVEEARALSNVTASGQHHIQADAPENFQIAGSRSELHSAMSNLLSNAVRYTPKGGTIVTGWHVTAADGAEFYVSDTGLGIAPEHLPRLTERFYRVDRSRSRETGGTGLGLAIVKHVAQRHGGQVSVESEVGVGSTFRIRLPASRILLAPA
jgi:two-component system, OmpR family, phosphate regulon sensor histidine kinase PhoR